MIQGFAKTLWYAFLIGLGLWTVGAMAGLVSVGFCMMAGCR